MSPDKRKILHKLIQKVGNEIQPLLPPHEKHPYGRQAQSHLYDVLKGIFGCSIHEVRDCRFNDCLEIIEFCKVHATEKSIIRQIKDKYTQEPKQTIATLEDWFYE